jgi:peptidoglycan-associated lipoprotein
MMKKLTKITLALLPALFLLFGCGTTGETADEGAAGQASQSADQAPAGEGADATAGTDQSVSATPMESQPQEVDPFSDPNNLLSKTVVYFDFDSSSIRNDALPIVKAHADYLADNSNVSFTLEGHADERGTREYNLALGERRADAVRRLLVANGVSPAQIKVVSYGEERPAVLGHDEDAWAMNRRAEFVYSNR